MIEITKTDVFGWEASIRGMRNPMNSWDRSDSKPCAEAICDDCFTDDETNCPYVPDPFDVPDYRNMFQVGPNDHGRMMSLARAGTEHSKYRRMIVVTCDIVAPSFWWPEFDTYKVGTVRNSCSKMHKIHVHEITIDDVSHEGTAECGEYFENELKRTIANCNELRNLFNSTGEKRYWRALLENLPHGYNMRATVMLNYENLAAMYKQRKDHKLDEWHTFCDWIKSLPYSEIITGDIDG